MVLVSYVLRKNIFTLLAKDNADLDETSTMVKSHYHATSVTVAQCPTEENEREKLERIYKDDGSGSKKFK